MRALIVDDERHVRSCIKLLADWESCGIEEVFEAETVEEAMAFFEETAPDLVFTDIRMPGRDGLELMEWIHSRYPQTLVAVISAYNDFDYAIGAMRSGAFDYLLKPIQPGKLDALLAKAQALFSEKEEQTRRGQIVLDKNERIMLALFLEGSAELPEHSRVRELCSAPLGLLTVDLFCAPNRAAGEKEIVSLLGEVVEGTDTGWVVKGVDRHFLIYVLLTGSEDTRRETAERVRRALEERLGGGLLTSLQIHAEGKNDTLRGADGDHIAAAVRLSAEAIDGVPLYECYGGTKFAVPRDRDMEVFFEAVRRGDRVTAVKLAGEWCDSLKCVETLTCSDVRVWWGAISEKCQKFLHRAGVALEYPAFSTQQILLQVLTENLRVSPDFFFDFIVEQAETLAENFGEAAGNANLAYRIEQDIQRHYAEPISLASLAAKYFRNPSYVARIFKERYHVSVVGYINSVRIEKAKVLLKTTDYPVARIAHLVGYNDEKYFCRIFKRVSELSPGDYRKL